MPLLTIARLTLHEAARRRLLQAVAVLTVLLIACTAWGFDRLTTLRDHGQPLTHADLVLTEATLVILLAFMFSFVLAMGAAFLAAPAIAADVESGLVLALLPRPIRRSDVLLGKCLGLAVLLVVYTAVAGGLEFVTIDALTGYLPPQPVPALASLAGQSLVLVALALLCSTRLAPITGGIIAVILFGMAWIAGIVSVIGATFSNTAITTAGTVVGLLVPTDAFWRAAVYNLEPAAMIAASRGAGRETPFTVPTAPSGAMLIWGLGWIVVVLALAVVSFNRRDL